MSVAIAVAETHVIETPDHPVLARIRVIPDSIPGQPRPKITPSNYISPSQVKKYLRCQAQYMFQYLYKLQEPQNSASFFGSALHAGAEAYLTTRKALIERGASWNHESLRTHAIDTAALYVRTQLPKEILWKKQWQNGPDETEETLLANVIAGVDMMADGVWRDLEALEIERGYMLEWKQPGVLPILGYPDVIVRTAEGPAVRDFKTGREKKALDARLDIALSTYAQAYEIHANEPVRKVGYHSFVRNKDPKIVFVESERKDGDLTRLRRIAAAMTVALRHGVYMPVDDSAICTSCAFFDRCREEFV